jgi:hypothetical protein
MYRIEVTCSYPDLGAIEMQLYTYGPYRRRVWRNAMVVHFHEADRLLLQLDRLDYEGMLAGADAAYGAVYSCVAECRFHEEQQLRRKGRSVLDAVVDAMLGRRPSDEA